MLLSVKLITITKVLIARNDLMPTKKLSTKYILMPQEQLNYVMLLHTHKDRTDNINLLEIAKEFVSFMTPELIF